MHDNRAQDTSPAGDPIETHTMWLDFGDEGECAITLDFTKLYAALRRAQRTRRSWPHADS